MLQLNYLLSEPSKVWSRCRLHWSIVLDAFPALLPSQLPKQEFHQRPKLSRACEQYKLRFCHLLLSSVLQVCSGIKKMQLNIYAFKLYTLSYMFCYGIQGGRSFIKNQEGRIFEYSSCNRHSLFFAT
jgi:hypothetical protein